MFNKNSKNVYGIKSFDNFIEIFGVNKLIHLILHQQSNQRWSAAIGKSIVYRICCQKGGCLRIFEIL